ncbi:MAG: hypothetical protein PUE80_01050 [bacterium]|nr:hypothetical protein [bacterium]
MEENKKSGGWDVRASKSPSEMAYRGQLHASERRSLKRSLEPATPKAMSLGGSVVANPHQIPHPSTRLNLFNLLGLLGL